MRRKRAEVLLDDALNNVFLESSLKPKNRKKKARLVKIPTHHEPYNEPGPSANLPSSVPEPDTQWFYEPEDVDHTLGSLPIRGKVCDRDICQECKSEVC